MIFGKTKLELKVGFFVLLGFLILAVFVLSIGGFKTWTSGYRVKFAFDFVNGVKIGAPVRFAGVDVGVVKEIKFNFDPQGKRTRVLVSCWVKNTVKVPQDSTIWVNTLGLLGEKYVEIIPGEDYANCLAHNQELAGVNPMPMHEVTTLAKKIANDLDVTLAKVKSGEGTVGKLIYDDTLYKELEAFVTDIRKNPWKLFFKTKEKK